MNQAARDRMGTLPARSRAASTFTATAALAAVVAVATLPGCSMASPFPSPSPTERTKLPPGLAVELLQQRSDRAPGRLQIRVSNSSDKDVVIRSARLDGGPLSAAVDWPRAPATVRGGTTVNLPVQLPPLTCHANEDEVVVTLGFDDGSTVDVQPADPLGAAAGLAAGACAAEQLARSVDVRGTGLTVTGTGTDVTATLGITLSPTGDGPAVEVVSLAPTVLITSPDGRPWPLDVMLDGMSSRPVVVEVDLRPRRCDAHALTENKVGTLFPLQVIVSGEEQTVTLPLDPGISDRILAFVSRACGLGD